MSRRPDETGTLVGASKPSASSGRGSGDPNSGGDEVVGHLHGGVPAMLGGRYRLTEPIADGAMATVWRAHDDVLARTVAVKILHDHLAADDEFRERFRREAIAAARLTHPNVVGMYDTGRRGRFAWLVMEFVEGVTLADILAEHAPLPWTDATTICEQVARALGYAHQHGLIHRDVKPANVLVADDGTVKVADFGIAKADQGGHNLTRTGAVLGTAAYLAPEQVRDQPIDGRADQYALACVLYEAATGTRPFEGNSSVALAAARLKDDPPPPSTVCPGLPPALSDTILRALHRDPEQRYPTVAAFADALAEVLADPHAAIAAGGEEDVDVDASDPPSEDEDPSLRNEGRWLAPMLALILLAGGLVLGGIWGGVLQHERLDLIDGAGISSLASEPRIDTDPTSRSTRRPPVVDGVIVPASIGSFDPEGSGVENDHMLTNLLDGNADTTWRTLRYQSPAFGEVKSGVGFWLDLQDEYLLESVRLRTSTPGVGLQIRVADQPEEELSAWDVVGTAETTEGAVEIELEDDPAARFVLVWVTGPLQQRDGRYVAELSTVEVTGGTE